MNWENEDGPPIGVLPPGALPPTHVENGPVVLPTLHLKFIPGFKHFEYEKENTYTYFFMLCLNTEK